MVSVEYKWHSLRPEQIEAIESVMETHSNTMYTMGGVPCPKWEKLTGYSKSKRSKYACYVDISNDVFWIQLGDGYFHRVLVIPDPPADMHRTWMELENDIM